eukprot:s348_g14.t1
MKLQSQREEKLCAVVLHRNSANSQAKVPESPVEHPPSVSRFESSFAVLCSLSCFLCILLVRRYVPGASKHWLCRTPHICVGSLVLVTFLQCGLSVWRYSQPAAPFQEAPVEAETALAETHMAPVEAAEVEVQDTSPAEDGLASSSEIPSEWPCGEVLTPVDFGAKGDGHHDDSSAVWAAIAHGIRCNSTVLLGPTRHRFLVMPNVLEVTAENLIIVFEAQLVGPTLEAWNPTLESWPKGSCAYAEAHCQRSGGQSPEFARSQWSLDKMELFLIWAIGRVKEKGNEGKRGEVKGGDGKREGRCWKGRWNRTGRDGKGIEGSKEEDER